MRHPLRSSMWWPTVAFALAACTCLPKGASNMDVGVIDRGLASWYGEYFHGWLTASGEIYDMDALTAAHRTLPLGTVVRVTNIANGRQILVRINDRGPYVNGRVLDLSHAAARALDMVQDGISPVQLEVVGYGQLVLAPMTLDLLVSGEAGGRELGRSAERASDQRHAFIQVAENRPLRLVPTDMWRERRVQARRLYATGRASSGSLPYSF